MIGDNSSLAFKKHEDTMNKKSYIGTWEGTISNFIDEKRGLSTVTTKQNEHLRVVINFQNGHFISATKYNVKNLIDNESIKGIIDKNFQTVDWNNKNGRFKWELIDEATVKVSTFSHSENKIISSGILVNKILR